MTIATGQEDSMPLTQTPTSITKLVKQAIKAFTTLENPPKPIHIKTDVMDNVMANLDPNENQESFAYYSRQCCAL